MSELVRCLWQVSLAGSGPVARAYLSKRIALTLPFQASRQPRRQYVRCEGDNSKPEDDPPLAVGAYLATADGFLVGYDSGEFGGALWWFDPAGTFRQSLSDENTRQIIDTPEGALVLTGIAHLTIDEGHVLRLTRRGQGWNVEQIPLPGAPGAALLDADGSLIIATTEHLVRLAPRHRHVKVLHRAAWSFAAANSMVKDVDGTLYLGMARVVARLRPTRSGYVEEWLAPQP